MTLKTHYFTVFIAICFPWVAAIAAKDVIQVELIVFQYNDGARAISEQFPNQLFSRSGNASAVTLNPQPNNEAHVVESTGLSYHLVEKDQLTMTPLFERLSNNPKYTPLLHMGWYQPDKRNTRSVFVEGGTAFDAYGDALTNLQQPSNRPAYWNVAGQVDIKKDSHYKTHLDLTITQNANNLQASELDRIKPAPSSGELLSFSINQYRHLTLDKIYYFDHPLFGVLMKLERM